MKKILLASIAATALLAGCNDDKNELEAKAPVLSDLDVTSYTLPGGEVDEYLFRMTWTAARFFTGDSPTHIDDISYEVEADVAEKNFAAPVVVDKTSGLYMDVFTRTLAGLHADLADGPEESVTVSFRVRATGAGIVSHSQSVSVTIYPYRENPGNELTKVEPGTITTPGDGTTVTLKYQGDNDPEAITVAWTETLFYFNDSDTPSAVTPLNYTLQMDMYGNGFATPVVLYSSSATSAQLTTNQLNDILTDTYNAPAGQPYDMELRLKTDYGQDESAGSVYSENTVKVTFVPFAPFDMLQPVYIYGNMNGWGTTNTEAMFPMFKEDSDENKSVYTFTGYFEEGWNFKFLPRQALGTYEGFSITGENTMEYGNGDGGAIVNHGSGFKTVVIDVKAMTYSFTDFDAAGAAVWDVVSMVGTFSGWDPTVYNLTRFSPENNHLWTIDAQFGVSPEETYHAGKFVANNSWDNSWQNILGMEWSTPYGHMVMASDPDVNIYFSPEAADYRVVFNDLTGQYIILRR